MLSALLVLTTVLQVALTSGTHRNAICKIQSHQHSPLIIKNPGDSLNLNCSSLGGRARKIIWRKGSTVVTQSKKTRSSQLVLGKITVKDAGFYWCEVYGRSSKDTCRTELRVTGPPAITSRSNIQEVRVGQNLAIPCTATRGPQTTVKWSQPLAKCHSLGRVHTIKQPDGVTMEIKSVIKADEGIYCCVAVNKFGRSLPHVVLVTVLYNKRDLPPQATPFSNVATVTEGDTATLTCAVDNVPKKYAAVFWTLNNQSLSNSKRLRTTTTFYTKVVNEMYLLEKATMTLNISAVTAKDAGVYSCGVVTHVGNSKAEIQLKITNAKS